MEDHDRDIQITTSGYLKVKRGAQLKQQFCPFSYVGSSEAMIPCGDWCPLFGEPFCTSGNEVRIDLCHGHTIWCPKDKFQDLRNKED